MFCTKCGSQVADNAKFCQKCGAPIAVVDSVQQTSTEPVSTASQKPVEPVQTATQEAVTEAGTTYVREPFEPRQTAGVTTPTFAPEQNALPGGDTRLIRTLIGNNAEYYLAQFVRIDNGEKSFNWLAFVFAPILLLYRKQFAYFRKLALPVYGALLAQMALATYATASFSFGLMTALPVTGVLVAAYAIVTAYLCGKNFNRHYQSYLKAAIAGLNISDESAMKRHKPSAVAPALFLGACVVASIILTSAVSAIVVNSWR